MKSCKPYMSQPPTLFIVSVTVRISYSCFQTLCSSKLPHYSPAVTASSTFVMQLEESEMVWNQRWYNCNVILMQSPAMHTFSTGSGYRKSVVPLVVHSTTYRAWNGSASHLFTEFWVCFSEAVISLVSLHWYFVNWTVYIDNRVNAPAAIYILQNKHVWRN